MRADKDALSKLLRRIAELGIAVILVEHDMTLVMGISDHVVVLDAGVPIASGPPAVVRRDPAVIKAYLGGEVTARSRVEALAVVRAMPSWRRCKLTAGYGAAPVLEGRGAGGAVRRNGGDDRCQRRRKVDHDARDLRPAAAG